MKFLPKSLVAWVLKHAGGAAETTTRCGHEHRFREAGSNTGPTFRDCVSACRGLKCCVSGCFFWRSFWISKICSIFPIFCGMDPWNPMESVSLQVPEQHRQDVKGRKAVRRPVREAWEGFINDELTRLRLGTFGQQVQLVRRNTCNG